MTARQIDEMRESQNALAMVTFRKERTPFGRNPAPERPGRVAEASEHDAPAHGVSNRIQQDHDFVNDMVSDSGVRYASDFGEEAATPRAYTYSPERAAANAEQRMERLATLDPDEYETAMARGRAEAERRAGGLDSFARDELADRFAAEYALARQRGSSEAYATNQALRRIKGETGRALEKRKQNPASSIDAPMTDDGASLADQIAAPRNRGHESDTHTVSGLIRNETVLDVEGRDSLDAVYASLRGALPEADFNALVNNIRNNGRRTARIKEIAGRARDALRADGVVDNNGALLKRTEAAAGEAVPVPDAAGFAQRQADFVARASRAKGVRSAVADGDAVTLTLDNGWRARVSEGGLDAADLGSHQIQYADGTGISLVKLRDLTDAATWNHELVHLGRETGVFTGEEWASLARRYGDGEEAIAEGLARSVIQGKHLMHRLKQFAARVWEAVSGQTTALGTESRFARGEMWGRQTNQISMREVAAGVKYSTGTRVQNVTELFDRVQADRGRNNGLWTDIAPVSEELAGKIRNVSNNVIDPTGYTHIADASAINHAMDHHGEMSDLLRGQIPINRDDIERIPEIFSNPDSIRYLGKSDAGLEMVEYMKRFEDGTEIYVEEARVGRRRMAMKTLYKRKTSENRDFQLYARDASRPEAGRSDAARSSDVDNSVPPPAGDVKFRKAAPAAERPSLMEQAGNVATNVRERPGRARTFGELFRQGRYKDMIRRAWDKSIENMVDNDLFIERFGDRVDSARGTLNKAKDLVELPDGTAAASFRSRNSALRGRLSASEETLSAGWMDPDNPGSILHQGNFWDDTLGVLGSHARNTTADGPAAASRFERLLEDANDLAVAESAVGRHDEALGAVDGFANRFLETGEIPEGLLLERGIVTKADLPALRALAEEGRLFDDAPNFDKLTRFLENKVDAWAQQATGLGGAAGKGDLAAARDLIATAKQSDDYGALRQAVDGMRDQFKAALEYARKSGMLSETEYARFQQNGDWYAPMQRVFEDIGEVDSVNGAELIKTLKGSQRDIVRPFEVAPQQVLAWKKASDRNKFFVELASDPAALREAGGEISEHSTPGAVAFRQDGKKMYMTFGDEDVSRAMRKIGERPALAKVVRISGAITGFMKKAITTDPFFIMRNKVRDSLQATIQSDSGLSLRNAAYQRWTPEDFMSYVGAGADQAGWYEGATRHYAKEQAEAIARLKGNNIVVGSVRGLRRGIRWLNDKGATVERSTRMAEYKAALADLEKRYPSMAARDRHTVAARRARESTLDFARSGSLGRELNAFIPFFNPAIQSIAKDLRLLRTDPARYLKKVAAYTLPATAAVYAWNQASDAGDEYAQLPSWRRDFMWNIKVGDHWLVIPKPHGAISMISGGAERLLETVQRGESNWGDYATGVRNAAMPADIGSLAGPLRGLVEVAMNRDLFRERYIVPTYEEGLDPMLRPGQEKASAIGRGLAWAFGHDARQYDHLINSFAGGWGRMATDLTRPKDNPDWGRTFTGGALRRASPYEATSYWEGQERAKRLGLNQTKAQREYNDEVQQMYQDGRSMRDILGVINRRRDELNRVSVEDRKRELDTKRANRK